MEQVIIVTSFSSSFVPVAGVSFFSLIKNANPNREYHIIILEDHLGSEEKYLLTSSLKEFANLTIEFYTVEKIEEFQKSFTARNVTNITVHTYFRLYMCSYFPEYSKILYLDPDTIVLEDIAKLFDTDISEYHIGAVRDVNLESHLKDDDSMKEYYESLGVTIDDTDKFFNGGVQLLNLSLMRANKIDEKIDRLLQEREFYWVVDQDIMNLAVEKVYYFDLKWNFHGYTKYVGDISLMGDNPPAIIHYTTPNQNKPWDLFVAQGYDVNINIFWQYARQTVFYEMLIVYPDFCDNLKRLKSEDKTQPKQSTIHKIKIFLKKIIIRCGLQGELPKLRKNLFVIFILGTLRAIKNVLPCIIDLFKLFVLPFRMLKNILTAKNKDRDSTEE